jgi:hypothetical protein
MACASPYTEKAVLFVLFYRKRIKKNPNITRETIKKQGK